MAGCRPGVANTILAVEQCALHTHCYGHALGHAVQESLKTIIFFPTLLILKNDDYVN